MFCAYGEDRDALQALGERLAALFHDKVALEKLVATVDPDFWD